MRKVLNQLILILLTFIVLFIALTLTFLLYRSELACQNWKTYNDLKYNFSIKYQYIKPINEKIPTDEHIIKKFIIPIKSPGLFDLQKVYLSVNVLNKKHFNKHIKKDNLILLNSKLTNSGEKYSFSPNPYKYNSYFFEYNDYVFEITEPYLTYKYEDRKIHEMILTILLPSFKRINCIN